MRVFLVALALLGSGPSLHVTPEQLRTALECSGPLSGLTRDPVLLTPAFSTAAESYGWNYRRQLPAIGITTCTLSLPDNGFGDLQADAEYVVAAVRQMHVESGRKVVLMGHQHGALDELWAMTFWPDIAHDTSELISLATPYNGTTIAQNTCASSGCPPSVWQISTGSAFLAALKAAGLPKGPDYTSIATTGDELIVPQPEASRLNGAGTSVTVQDICPGRAVDHFLILADAVAYALVLDALDHPGPADPARVDRSVCAQTLMPGVDASAVPSAAAFAARFVVSLRTQAVPQPPATAAYVTRPPLRAARRVGGAAGRRLRSGHAQRQLSRSSHDRH